MGWLNPRPQEDLIKDPALIFQVGQLMGMSRLAGKLLTEQDEPDIKQIGQALLDQVAWFYYPTQASEQSKDKQDTLVLPPARKAI